MRLTVLDLPVRNSLYGLLQTNLYIVGHHSRDRCSQAFFVFCALPLPCITQTEKQKKWRRPGNEASYYVRYSTIYMYMSAHSYHLHTAFIKEDTQSLREATAKEEAAEAVNKNRARSLDQC